MNKQEAIIETLRKYPLLSNAEIVKRVFDDYQIQTTESTVATIKSRKLEAISDKPVSDSVTDLDYSVDRPSFDSSLVESVNSNAEGNTVHNTLSDSGVSSDQSGAVSNGSETVTADTQIDDSTIPKALDQIPTGDLEITLGKGEKNPEAESMAQNYVQKVQLLKEKEADKAIESGDIENNTDVMNNEEIDLKLLSDNVVELTDQGLARFSSPLDTREKAEGNRVIGRMIKRRVSWIVPYGDIVNVGLWLSKIIMKRIFRVKPKFNEKTRRENK